MPLIVYSHGHGLGDNIDDLKMKNILLPCGKEERGIIRLYSGSLSTAGIGSWLERYVARYRTVYYGID